MTEMQRNEGLEKLREPFPASAISHRPQGGVQLSYVGHAETTDRLLSVDPLWSWEPFAVDAQGSPIVDYDAQGHPVGLWIKLTVCGVTRPGYGSCLSTKSDGIKELIGDAIRNAAMRYGVALDLWAKGDLESGNASEASQPAARPQATPQGTRRPAPTNGNAPQAGVMGCPKCKGDMWDNRAKKSSGQISAKSPDFKCKDKACEGVIWPPRESIVVPNGSVPPPDDDDDWATPQRTLTDVFADDMSNRQVTSYGQR